MKLRTSVAGIVFTSAALGVIAVSASHGASAPTQTVVGNLAPATYWYHQTTTDCGEASSAVVIGALTGTAPTDSAILGYAAGAGLYNGGTEIVNIPTILRHYGVTALAEQMTLPQLETALQFGDRVVAGVNAETLWATQGYKVIPGTTLDHAVVVDQINETTGMVTLTDTGIPTGRTETISVATFVQAWGPGASVVANI